MLTLPRRNFVASLALAGALAVAACGGSTDDAAAAENAIREGDVLKREPSASLDGVELKIHARGTDPTHTGVIEWDVYFGTEAEPPRRPYVAFRGYNPKLLPASSPVVAAVVFLPKEGATNAPMGVEVAATAALVTSVSGTSQGLSQRSALETAISHDLQRIMEDARGRFRADDKKQLAWSCAASLGTMVLDEALTAVLSYVAIPTCTATAFTAGGTLGFCLFNVYFAADAAARTIRAFQGATKTCGSAFADSESG